MAARSAEQRPRAESHSEDDDSASSSQSQSSGPRYGPLQSIPTVVEDKNDGGAAATDEGEDNTNANGKADSGATTGPSPGLVAKIMQKLGLNPLILLNMFKASLAPTIAIAMYQAAPVRSLLLTLGYLSGVISVLALPMLPRGKFIQSTMLNVLCAALGGAVGMLIAWSSVQARLNTSNLAELAAYIAQNGKAPYNSSQSAVCGVWLFFSIWLGNTVRAKFPAFNLPVIIFSIIVNIAATFGVLFPTVATAESFIKELLIAIFIGIAIAVGCSLFVFPISTRQIVVAQMAGVLGLFKKTVALEKEYLQGLERDDMFSLEVVETSAGHPEPKKKGEKTAAPKMTREQKTALALRGTISAIRELMGKIYGDKKFAKRDVAFGYLSAKDFGKLFDLLRNVMIPLTGIGVIMDIFQKVGRDRGWDGSEPGSDELGLGGIASSLEDEDKERSVKVWNDIMRQLHEPFEILSGALIQGIDHAGILLKFFPQPKDLAKTPDVEASAGELKPGQVGFSKVVKEKIETFNSRKGEILRLWAKEKGLSSDGKQEHWTQSNTRLFEKRRNDQAQLFTILYLEKLMQATGEAVLGFVEFAEEKHRDGSITKKHLIIPDARRLRKWFLSIFKNDDSTAEDCPDILERNGNVVFLGQSWMHKKDPEHLPATNALQKFGNGLRNFSNFFGSHESIFGLRVALATMSIGIIAFLEPTQSFFIEQRLVWAMIMIALGMSETSGQSIFGFFCRTGGTLVAVVNCYIIWYICDHRTPGVIVFLWLFIFIQFYFFFKFPQFLPGIMICIITQILIVGYELQVESLGVARAESSGQPVYPLYILAPFRLATVAGGCLVAFFWTVFPSPSTDRTWLRKDLSATLYVLANYSSVIHATLRSVVVQDLGDATQHGTPAHSLLKVRRKLFGKLTLLLPSLQAHANFQKFEPNLGGKFPTEQYQDVIRRCVRLLNYFTLMSYILTWSPIGPIDESEKAWLHLLDEAIEGMSPVHNQILSTLVLLSNSLLSGQSLPPYLPLPKPFEMMQHLLRLPSQQHSSRGPKKQSNTEEEQAAGPEPAPEAWNLLDARNMEQQGYTEFAVLQVCSTLIVSELRGLIVTVSDLVGTVDFSFRVDRPDDSSDTSDEGVQRSRTWASRVTSAAGIGGRGKGKND